MNRLNVVEALSVDDVRVAKEIRVAIRLGETDKAIELIGRYDNLLRMISPFGTWLHFAAMHGRLDIVKHLVALGIDVNTRSGASDGNPLYLAASHGHLSVVEYLLSRGAEMDVGEPERNALFGAICGGHTAVAKFLIDQGIDTRVKYTGENMKNMDALAFAVEWGRIEIADILKGNKSG